MATFRGFIRTAGAYARRAEREQQRRVRETTKKFKEQQKNEQIHNGQKAVIEWNNYVEMIQSLHKDCSEEINWQDILNIPRPIEPTIYSKNEDLALLKLQNFKPNFFHKFLNLTQKRIDRLERAIVDAKNKDNEEYNLTKKDYEEELKEWELLNEIALGVQNRKNEYFEKAIDYFKPFNELKEIGTMINFSFYGHYSDIDLYIRSENMVPDYELSQTSTGKLSKKKMPKTRFNEIYQDYICSCTLRIAREIFAHLPLKYVRINAISDLLNSQTGYLEKKPVLSVIIPLETINKLSLTNIDPSESMKNFVHNMDFKKLTGFNEVRKVNLG
jgi:hypothetical protein